MPSAVGRLIRRLVLGPRRGRPDPGESPIRFEGGDGSTRGAAIVVRGANYDMEGTFAQLGWLCERYGQQGAGWQMTSHATGTWQDRHIDTVEIELAGGASQTLYFDVTESFGEYPSEEWFVLVQLAEQLREAVADRAALRQQQAPFAERWAAVRRVRRVRNAMSWVNVYRLGRRTILRAGLLAFALPLLIIMEFLAPALGQQTGMIDWSSGRTIPQAVVVYVASGAFFGWVMWRIARWSYGRTRKRLEKAEKTGGGIHPGAFSPY